jgi:hypothetical protein
VNATASLSLSGLFTVGSQPVTVPGRTVAVSGVVRPYVPGQRVLVKALVGSRLVAQRLAAVTAAAGGRSGAFTASFSSPSPATVSIVVEHGRNSHMLGFERHASFAVLDESVGPGSTGRMVELVQQRLAALHFYIPQTGVYDLGTELAVDAYHRMLRAGTSQLLDAPTIGHLLDGTGTFTIRFPDQGRHAEGDLSDQLLALIDGSQVELIFPISSGKPSTPTVLGSWQVYSRVPGYLPDGMYFSDFFIRGYAIHGYDPAPDYPASHGCMRLPIVDAITAFNWLALGDWVDTYYT